MTQSEILNREITEIKAKRGIYIPAYRMAQFMAAANKVMDIVIKTFPGISYYEMQIVLKIVQCAISESMGAGRDSE